MKVQNQIRQEAFKPIDGFIKSYQELIKKTVIPYQYDVLWDKAKDNTEKSHVVKNFINAGKAVAGEDTDDGFYGMVFQDSDAAKWIEAVAYSLSIFPDAELEKSADELIDIISRAQDKDGYLDTYFTIKDKDKRWSNLCEGHELYCSGHMIEAACAYAETTGKTKLLDVMKKNVECIHKVFLEGDDFHKKGIPGHPEVELALMKMYRLTGDKKCLELASHFIDERGKDPEYYKKEVARRSWSVWGSDGADSAYMQAHLPVREQKDAKGHAVRAVYLYTGMADLASETKDESLVQACKNLWKSITEKQSYVSGGIGSTNLGEAFTVDYDLPSDTAYCETCAAIGLIFFGSRMLEMDVDRLYSDQMERAFYNAVLAGMQLDGKRFFYVNPLEVIPGISGVAQTHKHTLPQRPTWYACACCPPNVARLLGSFGKYAYGENEGTVFCHLFAAGEIRFQNGLKIRCTTLYPDDFSINYEILEGEKKIAIRVPSWNKSVSLTKNGAEIDLNLEKGYAYLDVKAGDRVRLELDESPYRVYPSAKVPALSNQVAVFRGPVLYCGEGADNDGDAISLRMIRDGKISVEGKIPGLEIQSPMLSADGMRQMPQDELYSQKRPEYEFKKIKMIPYFAWGNRGENQMRVWFQETTVEKSSD